MTHSSAPAWREIYSGGSQVAEERQFDQLIDRMLHIQRNHQKKSGRPKADRTLHAKQILGVNNAVLQVRSDLPPELACGHMQAGQSWPAMVRFSNASGAHGSDRQADMRGVAISLSLPGGQRHDVLMTSFPVSHVRNAQQFVRFAEIAAGPRAWLLPRLLLAFGPAETWRMVGNLRKAVRPSASLALERYWTRGALLWDQAGPVRLRLSPLEPGAAAEPAPDGPDALREELARRLSAEDVRFELAAQRFVDERRTPVEDGVSGWDERDAPFVPIATLHVPRQELDSAEAQAMQASVQATAFNPWNAPDAFRPLGNINRIRRRVYDASARVWQSPT